MARIVHILCNTLQNRKYLSLCTDMTSNRHYCNLRVEYYQYGTFQNGRLHTEPDTVKNRLFSFLHTLNYWLSFTHKSAPFSQAYIHDTSFHFA